jgi:hypothetical protein
MSCQYQYAELQRAKELLMDHWTLCHTILILTGQYKHLAAHLKIIINPLLVDMFSGLSKHASAYRLVHTQ